MSGLSGAVALTIATVVSVSGGSQRAPYCGDPLSAYALNGQNVERPRANAGRYPAENIIATRVQVWDDRAFVLMPRFRSGVPFTVSMVRLDCQNRCWPILSPYPFWSLHDESDSTAIQNPVDMHLDPTGIIWVLDTGQVNATEQPIRRIQPKIIAIDVQTNKVVNRIDLSGLTCSASRLNYVTVDYGDDGRAFVYVSDAATRAVIVWEVQADRGYRVVLPNAIAYDCTSNRDMLYIALAHRSSGSNVLLYLTYLTSNRLYSIDTCNLRKGCSQGTVTDLGLKPGKMVVLGTDGRTTVYFRYRGQCDIYAWDMDRFRSSGSFNPDRFVLVRKADGCNRLATHVTPGYHDGVLWMLESNFPDYISGTVGVLGANVRLRPLRNQCDEKT